MKSNNSNPSVENVTCQRCLEKGHWTYQCQGKRKFAHRTSRTKLFQKKIKQAEEEKKMDLLKQVTKTKKSVQIKFKKTESIKRASESSSDSDSSSDSSDTSDDETTSSSSSSTTSSSSSSTSSSSSSISSSDSDSD